MYCNKKKYWRIELFVKHSLIILLCKRKLFKRNTFILLQHFFLLLHTKDDQQDIFFALHFQYQ